MSGYHPSITRPAPAKVNLTLAVLGRRPDGFHDIESWMVPVSWCDRLTFRPSDSFSLRVHGEPRGAPADESNLVHRAAHLLAAAAGRDAGCEIKLVKNIPTGGGLGGGSSDAAAALMGLNDLWGLSWSRERLAEFGAQIGSDVPFFIHGGPAVVRGRGEIVEPLEESALLWLVIVVPPFSISTQDVYSRLQADRFCAVPRARPWEEAVTPPSRIASLLFNDLESPAFAQEPRLAALHAALDQLEGRPVRMTGSGSCLYAVFDARDAAESWQRAAQRILPSDVRTRVVSTQ